jgi:beta-glucosidase
MLALAIGTAWPAVSPGQSVPSEVADDARIDALLQQMTPEEKMNLIRGGIEDPAVYQGQAGYIPGVPRLHVPSLRLADGPPGVLTRVPAQAETATMGVAATFSTRDAEANGVVIGRDARSLGIDVVLQPYLNIDRDITAARGYNTLGEDAFLTGQMGAAEIRGVQSQGVMAQAKHFVAYDSNSYNIAVDLQTLHEVYVAPFAEAVRAGVASIMCSYNRLNGPFACDSSDALKRILRDELTFKGFVTSDWGAVHSVLFINEGLDMEMPGTSLPDSPVKGLVHNFFVTAPAETSVAKPFDPASLAGMLGGPLPEEPALDPMAMAGFPMDSDGSTMRAALAAGSVREATVTAAARHVLYEMDRFGYLDGKQKHQVSPEAIEANADVIRATAEDAAVLLKNEHALPLGKADLESLALIGPGAAQIAAIGIFSERSPGLTYRQVGPYAALEKTAPSAHVTLAVDDDLTGTPVPAAALSHDGKPGLMRSEQSEQSRVDATIDFTHSNAQSLPANSTVTWTGTLSVPGDGSYWLYLQVLGARGKLFIDGKPVSHTGAVKDTVHGDVQHATQDGAFPTIDGLDNVRSAVTLSAGAHTLEVTASGDTSDQPEQIRLNWVTPQQRSKNHQVAIEAARRAHTAIVFVWTRGAPDFGLPGDQDKLVEEVAAVNPHTIVVLNVSQPVKLPWLDKVRGVLQMWWTGDEGGWATANLLLGNKSPAGRLPFTWAKRLEDYAANDPTHPERSAKGVNGTTTYSEGLNVGYRWFDQQHIEPLFPFGFGLSYASFEYSNLRVAASPDGGLDVSLRLKSDDS